MLAFPPQIHSAAALSERRKVHNLPTEALNSSENRGRREGGNSPPTAIISLYTVIWLSETAGSIGWSIMRAKQREKSLPCSV